MDSPFYKVEEKLNSLGHSRHDWESFSLWFQRLAEEGHGAISFDTLTKALAIHTRMRFDPAGISVAEREEMKRLVEGWMSEDLPAAAEKSSI